MCIVVNMTNVKLVNAILIYLFPFLRISTLVLTDVKTNGIKNVGRATM